MSMIEVRTLPVFAAAILAGAITTAEENER
jgi:hypothetical protein